MIPDRRPRSLRRTTLGPVSVITVLVMMTACGPSSPKARTDTPEPAKSPPATAAPVGKVIRVGGEPEGMVADDTTGLVAIGVRGPDGVVIVDHDGGVVRRVPLTGAPRHLGFDPVTHLLLAPTEGSDKLETIDLATGSVTSSTPVGRQPHDAAAAAGRLFAGNELADSMSVIEDSKVASVVPMPVQPGGVASNGRTVAVVGVRGRQMKVVDAATLRPLGTVRSGVGPTHVVAGPDGRYYVADTQGDKIIVYTDQPQPAQVGTAEAVGAPYGIAVDGGRKRLWVALSARNQLVEYDISGRLPKRLATFPTVQQPNSVVVDAPTGLVLVAGATPAGELQIFTP
ncbi:MAG: YncE family protein [Actinomycetota bacterium]|nr:YncE family protein [Actinomycetota bacterium]